MSVEDKYFPFKKEFIEIIDSFGYYNEMRGKFITLDLKRKNLFSKQISAPLGRMFDHFDGLNTSKKGHRVLEKLKGTFSPVKGPFVKELFADFFLLGAFGNFDIQINSLFHNLFAVLLITISIAVILKGTHTLLKTVKEVFRSTKPSYASNALFF